MKVIVAVLSLAVAALPQERTATNGPIVQWSQEPDSFRGLKFGSSEAEAKRSFDGVGRCINMPGELRIGEVEGRGCGAQFKIGDASVNGVLRLANDKFVQGMFKFDSKTLREFEIFLPNGMDAPRLLVTRKLRTAWGQPSQINN
jgi:hypothetical protein